MSGKIRVAGAITLILTVGVATLTSAYPRFARATKMSCATCHTKVSGGPDFTDAGKAFKADSTKVPAASVAGAEFVSLRKCKTCHLKEYKGWQDTPHSHAFELLKTATPEKIADYAKRAGVTLDGPASENKTCLQCHVTGSELAGGYPAADSLKNVALAAVTCEACHGPGSKHVVAEKDVKKNFINMQVSEGYCRQCHTPVMSPKFDFKEYKAKGVHVVAAATP